MSFAVLVTTTGGNAPIQAAGLAALIAFALEYARRQKLARLRSEFARSARSTNCLILINGVVAGSVPEPDYIEMRIRSMLDPRNYVGQFFEVARFLLICLAVTAVAMPVLLFWWLVIAAAVAPERVLPNLTPFYAIMAAAPSIASTAPLIGQVARTILTMGAMFSVLTSGALGFFSSRSPITNVFQRAVNERLRRITGTVARGDVGVSRTVATSADSSDRSARAA
ncbi:hypothetical protein R75461_07984 [Paraburkholderia nemoris]|uniref:hypothetical protein n=1 Tax=Paraburkholderia nemoris TaxID=2793076 RepID=UPI0019091DB7|nr:MULTISPECIES: hypothetical protein [Paraburkholderia]MBK3786721.1 hypothetical protein [Paraburkholderia aspalathi]CAE6861012.1 hypothetical protein R75461_07984 [Paraburkholderia nemoris]